MISPLNEFQFWPNQKWVRVVIVQNNSGQLSGLSQDSNSLTNPLDRELFLSIRNSAKLVITGANSIRFENPPAPSGEIWILSRKGALSPDAKVFKQKNAWVLSQNKIENLPTKLLNATTPESIVDLASQEQLNHILVEGGINVIKQFINSRLIDEAIITVVDRPGVGENLHRSQFGLTLVRQIKIAGVSYQKWVKEKI